MLNIFKDNNDPEMDTYDLEIQVVMTSYPTDIVVYGQDIEFRNSLQYRLNPEINDDGLATIKEYQAIILNDQDGNLEITDEELLLIKSYTIDGSSDFFYIGTKELDRLSLLGFGSAAENDASLTVINYYGRKITFEGVWSNAEVEHSKNNPELLGMIIISHIVRGLRSNH